MLSACSDEGGIIVVIQVVFKGFVNLSFGRGNFGGENLYYTNLGSGTVGRLRVGLGD